MNWTKKIIKSAWYRDRQRFYVFHKSSYSENRIRSWTVTKTSIRIVFIYSDFMLCCDFRVQNQSQHENLIKKKVFSKLRIEKEILKKNFFFQNFEFHRKFWNPADIDKKKNQIDHMKKRYEDTWLSAWSSTWLSTWLCI